MFDLQEIRIARESEEIRRYYEREYEKTFRARPFIEDSDNQIFAFLSKNYSVEKARVIISVFLRMPDKWFIDNGYSPSVIRKNINKILMAAGPKLESAVPQRDGIQIATDLSCDRCRQYYRWVGNANDLEKERVCPQCREVPNGVF